jgi:hypothetical protein
MARFYGASPEIVQAAFDQANRMREYQNLNGAKVPDLP